MNSKSNSLSACLGRVAILAALSLCQISPSYAVNVTFGWDANDEPDLKGYKVHRNVGSPGPPYKYKTTLPEKNLADPLHPKLTLTGLEKDTKYYVALTAYDTDGNESGYSDDVCVEIVDAVINACASSAGSAVSSGSGGGGGGGGGCFISSTCAPGPDSHSSSNLSVIFSVAVLLVLLLILPIKFILSRISTT